MSIILGIDPGSRITGFGIIHSEKSQLTHIENGCIQLGQLPFAQRLEKLFLQLEALLKRHNINETAIEQVFVHINAKSALQLGQARGTAIAVAALHKTKIHEYSARQIKQAVVGYGAANKLQVQHMVRVLLNLPKAPPSDAADALAVAICHAQTTPLQQLLFNKKLKQNFRFRRGRLR